MKERGDGVGGVINSWRKHLGGKYGLRRLQMKYPKISATARPPLSKAGLGQILKDDMNGFSFVLDNYFIWVTLPPFFRKLHTATAIPIINSILFLGTARPQPQFPHSCVCERFIYSQDRSTYFLKADPSWEYIIRSQTHECENWDWVPDIPFLGIFVSNFRHFVFAVQVVPVQSVIRRPLTWPSSS